ncbi:TolC family protein (plasmid) [Flammeovirgaceae bacterium SG7u.111]|nr:TolC family protein [Flammeovirgaceae bacterium SG7u.132]WPO38839.1 TolC family protein [Flammeovirgaceae bacterium SG7u.111]
MLKNIHVKIQVKFLSVLLYYCFLPLLAFSQDVDYNKIILPDEIDSVGIQEHLVRLAWKNNPGNSILEKQRQMKVYQEKMQKSKWLNQVKIQGNLNEATINPPENFNNNVFYPRYNFSVMIPLGIFTEQKYGNQIAKIETEIAAENIKLQKLQVRALVIEQYQRFNMYRNQYKLIQQLVEDEYSKHLIVEQKFKNGEVSLDDYSESLKTYNNELLKRYSSEADFQIAKAQLEMLIGIPLEEAY